jgi:sulfatase maturation enzyme AslB (radical SAM superfamily)
MTEKTTQIVGTCLGLILVPVLIGLGMSAQEKHDEKYPWLGTFYMYGNVESDNNELKTVEECREWANKRAESKDLAEGEWDYECGTGCKYADDTIKGGQQIKTYNCAEVTK